MRLFVAMDLSETVRAAVAQMCDKLRRACPAARWVRTEGMHITLKFIGETNEDRMGTIREALRNVHSSAPAEMVFRKLVFFPNERRPRVLWVGIEASPNLGEIAREIESKLEHAGIPKEPREFKPHLTLARFNEPRGLDVLQAAIREAGEANLGSMRTGEMYLYKSNLERGGAQYVKLETFPIAPMP
ncbi:MAG TPA: RNA 2',3'-cyclic phosphodiesterase [Candidatus Limnocylindrales bacterium]|nr:RNA 2',3'-cyclic phosphodiesterase [Candidatus Limnocylindrales bacterium]